MLNRVGSCQPSVSQVPPWGLLHSRCSVTTRWSLDELLAAESWLSLWQAAEHWWTPEPQFTYLYVSVWQCSLCLFKGFGAWEPGGMFVPFRALDYADVCTLLSVVTVVLTECCCCASTDIQLPLDKCKLEFSELVLWYYSWGKVHLTYKH